MATQNIDPDLAAIAQAMINTSHLPVLLMDGDLRVVAASRSFSVRFQLIAENTIGCRLSELGAGEWNVPQLRSLLELALNDGPEIDGYKMDLVRTNCAPRHLLMNAQKVAFDGAERNRVLLTIDDITDALFADEQKDDMLRERRILLEEVQHRVANSLQIIASILMLKARAVQSEESRRHLEDAHQRVLSIAAIQEQLRVGLEDVEICSYLVKLCASLSASMIQGTRPIELIVETDKSTINPRDAVSIGLVVTELVINALKHAFPNNRRGKIIVSYWQSAPGWVLAVEDDGAGLPTTGTLITGLGTSLIAALAGQLKAEVIMKPAASGLRVCLVHKVH